MEADGADGLVVSDNGEHLANRVLIVKLAARHRVPTIYPYREFAEIGGEERQATSARRRPVAGRLGRALGS
jgi:hypothetical protein